MKTSIIAGLVAVAFGMGMTISGEARASGLGYCGPENQGQTKEIVYYHNNGMVSHYWQFMCNGGQWEESAHWYCDTRGAVHQPVLTHVGAQGTASRREAVPVGAG